MPRFDIALKNQAMTAVSIVGAGEFARLSGNPPTRRIWSVKRLEALYELAYLRVFAAWEMCLEALFYRSLCGYASGAGQERLIRGTYYPSISAAEAAVLGGKGYILWHNPQTTVNRCRAFILSGPGCPCVLETVINSHFSRLQYFADARHRIVHYQADAKRKFDVATTHFAGRTYPASRPGKFLRDHDASKVPPQRWLDVILGELNALLAQMV